MNRHDRALILENLLHDPIDSATVLRVLSEKLVTLPLDGFSKLFDSSASTQFSYATKVGKDSTTTHFKFGLRQYVTNMKSEGMDSVYFLFEMRVPEPRPVLEEYVKTVLAPESELVYLVSIGAKISKTERTIKFTGVFSARGLCVFEKFWSSRPGRFIVAKYNDYFLN